MEWFDEKIEKIKGDRFIYKFVCFFLGGFKHRLSYKELYLILLTLNRKSLGEDNAKKMAMKKILKIYKDLHNNKLPDGVTYDE